MSPRALCVIAILFSCVVLTQPYGDAAAADEFENTTPPTTDVQWQIGVGAMAYWSGEDALINVFAANTTSDDWPDDVYDRETQTFLKVPPAEQIWLQRVMAGLLRNGANFDPDSYAGDYIVEWDGDGELGVGLTRGRQIAEGPNRVRETYDGQSKGWASVEIKKIGGSGVSNIRVYRAEHEAALKAGKIFNPDFVKHIARYDIVRTMDWNGSYGVTRADQISDISAQFWGGRIVPIQAQFKLAEEAGVSIWINAPSRLGAPDGLNKQLGDMHDQQQRKALIETQFDAVAASPEWDNYATLIVEGMVATGYPIDRPFYLELANETWNWGGGFSYATEWYWSLTSGLAETTGKFYPGNPSRGAYGYLSARLAEAFAKALDAAGRADQQWTMVLGAQTAWDQQIVGPLEGVKDYAVLTASDNSAFIQPMARYGVTTTGYYRGAFEDTGGGLFGRSVKGDAWRAEWLRRLDADPEAFAQYLYDYMASAKPRMENVAWVVAQSKLHEQIAKKYGARYIGQYEGSSHDTLDRELAKNVKALAFYKAWQAGPRHAAIIRLQAEQMSAAFPGVILSNYQHYGNDGVNPKAPWVFNTLWGAETEAEKALNEVVGQ
jgi:hypothetical protein